MRLLLFAFLALSCASSPALADDNLNAMVSCWLAAADSATPIDVHAAQTVPDMACSAEIAAASRTNDPIIVAKKLMLLRHLVSADVTRIQVKQ